MNLKDKTAIVTGASDGLGKQVAIKLAAQGVNLALIARDQEGLKQTEREIKNKSSSVKVNFYPLDITNTQELKGTVNRILKDFSSIQILLNIAGIWQKRAPLEEIDELTIGKIIQTNLTALIHCTRLCLPYLKSQPEAAIINISSRSGVRAAEGQSVYSASKWGVRGFTEVLKEDLKDTNVRIAAIYQAGVNTQMFAKSGEKMPLEKYTEPDDLADVIVFMLSRPPKIWLHDVRIVY